MVWRRARAHCNQKLLKGAVLLLGVSLVVFFLASSVRYDYRRSNYGSCSCVCPLKQRIFPLASVLLVRLGILSWVILRLMWSLQETVAKETVVHTKALREDAKKTSLRFRVEAKKCNAGVAACKLSRERAEAWLVEEHKLAALWEKRARDRGWKDSDKVYLYG